jgi:hypothetical protein
MGKAKDRPAKEKKKAKQAKKEKPKSEYRVRISG